MYAEDQYLWSTDVASVFARALRREPELRLVFVIPRFPDQDGRISMSPNLIGRAPALEMLRAAGGNRVAVYGLENAEGTPIYVHAKACVVDDTWACIGSDNANRRSWTHDSELSAGFADSTPTGVARSLRLELAYEHLGDTAPRYDLDDPVEWFNAFRDTALALDDWHHAGRAGPRPPRSAAHLHPACASPQHSAVGRCPLSAGVRPRRSPAGHATVSSVLTGRGPLASDDPRPGCLRARCVLPPIRGAG